MEEFTEDGITRDQAESETASELISELEELAPIDGPPAQLRQTTYPANEVDLRPKRIDPRLVAFNDFDPRDIAPYNRLVISLISAAASRKLKRVLIASPQYGDGRTTVTLNLAAALARARQRVLVVESDFLRPSALRLLGVDSATGLADAVTKGLAPARRWSGCNRSGSIFCRLARRSRTRRNCWPRLSSKR
jgi:Mrp family chromosome partitioning ATPase